MFASRFDHLPTSPFPRLDGLLAGIPPGKPPIVMSIGEPGHALPDFVAPVLEQNLAGFSRYPPARGTDEFRNAVADWLARRYPGTTRLDPEAEILPVCGSREALFSLALVAVTPPRTADAEPPAALMPNPLYQTYATAAVAAGAEPVLLTADAATGHLPDLEALPATLFERTAIFYLCSPANPQGAAASLAYYRAALDLARRHGFILVADECYSELYADEPPPGALQAAAELGEGLANLVVFNSLSKRSNLAGLRSGFCAGDRALLAAYLRFRNIAAPQLSLPIQAVSVRAWSDEAHVEQSRALYRVKYELAGELLGETLCPAPPTAGMFLWLDVSAFGGGETAALTLWRDAGVKVLPGAYISVPSTDGANPGASFIRVALVHDIDTTAEALSRIAASLTN